MNQPLFELAVEYVELVRLYQPEMNAATHHSRATWLLLFLYWITQRGVRSLNDVTQDHLTLFLQNLEFGTEWVLEMPHRLNPVHAARGAKRQRAAAQRQGDNRPAEKYSGRNESIGWTDHIRKVHASKSADGSRPTPASSIHRQRQKN